MGKTLFHGFVALCSMLLVCVVMVPADAQGQVLVIQGGTLIDGNGGAPVPNSVVVVQGNQITAVGQAGQVQIPAGAEVIDASGKWVLPGLWDAQASYSWTFGELFLHHGVTSQIDIGLGGEVSIAARDAVNAGLQRGPREWIGIAHFGAVDPEDFTGYETPYDGRQLPQTFEELQNHTRLLLDAGADMIMFHNGAWDPQWVEWSCNEAHSRNKPCFQRASGPRTGIVEAAEAGIDVVHHARGASAYIVRDGVDVNNTLDHFANMDEAKAAELIDILVREEVYLVPNIIHDSPGYPRDWPQMQAAYEELFSNPALLAYFDPAFLRRLRRTRSNVNTGALRERRMPGYQNMLRFYRMLDAAGGKVLVGGDTNGAKVPGSIVHEEMAIFQEAGIPRMHIIQGATSWPAEAMRVSDRIGTVEAGKLADIIVVNADPLQDISNLRNIDTVIQNGRVIDRDFHASYSVPFAGHDADHRYTINDRKWVSAVKREMGTIRGDQAANPDASPFPGIEAISPTMISQGSAPTYLTLTGFNFTAASRVYIGDSSVSYKWVSPNELQVLLDRNVLSRAGRLPIVVKNPQPMIRFEKWGDGTSNTAHLIVQFR